jgi:hypothetical protein
MTVPKYRKNVDHLFMELLTLGGEKTGYAIK